MRHTHVDIRLVARHLGIAEDDCIVRERGVTLSHLVLEHDGEPQPDADALYLLDLRGRSGHPLLGARANVLVLADGDCELRPQLGPHTNLAVAPHSINPDELVRSLGSFFSGVSRLGEVSMALMAELEGPNILHNHLDVGSLALGNPVALLDTTSRLVESSTSPLTGGAVWNAVVSGQQAELGERERSWLLDGMPKLVQGLRYPKIVTGSVEGRAALMGVEAGGGATFTLAVQERDRPLGEQDLPVIWYLGRFLSFYLRSRQRGGRHDSVISIIEDIASGFERDDMRIARRASVAGLKLPRGARFLIFRSSLETVGQERLETVSTDVVAAFNCPVLVHEGSVIALVGEPWEVKATRLTNPAGRDGWRASFFCGVSNEIPSTMELRRGFSQASEALRWGMLFHRSRRILDFRLILFCSLLGRVDPACNLENYCDQHAMEILRYDLAHGTSYASTLYTWLKLFKHVDETARTLGVHHNTVLYRLNKIRELFDLDIDDSQEGFYYMLTYDILVSRLDHPEERHALIGNVAAR